MTTIPIFAIILIGSIIVAFALFKDEIIGIIKELIVDFAFGLVFTVVIDLILPLTKLDIIISIFGIMFFIFIVHILKAPARSSGQSGYH